MKSPSQLKTSKVGASESLDGTVLTELRRVFVWAEFVSLYSNALMFENVRWAIDEMRRGRQTFLRRSVD